MRRGLFGLVAVVCLLGLAVSAIIIGNISNLVASLHARAPWAAKLPGPLREAAKAVANRLSGHGDGTSLSEAERRFMKSTFPASNLRTTSRDCSPSERSRSAASASPSRARVCRVATGSSPSSRSSA